MKWIILITVLLLSIPVVAFDISTIDWGNAAGGGGAAANGSVGYWSRVGTLLSPITAGDDISTTGTGTFGGLVDTSLLDTYIPYSNSNTLTGDIGLNYEKKDGYVVLDGTNDYVTITDSVALSPTDDLTVFIWAKGAGQAKQIFSHYDYGAGQRAWSVAGGGAGGVYFKIIISDDGSYDAANIKEWTGTDTVLLDNTWNSVAFTFASGTLKMFVDGIEQTTITKTTDAAITTIHDSTKSLTLGTYLNNDPTPGSAYFAGGLDNAMVIDRVLSPAEITALHALGRDAEYTDANLQGNWRFDDGTADDNTANAGDGTLVNGAYITDLSILQVPKIEVNELDVLGGNLTFKRYDEANFLIESLNHDTAAVILKRTGDAYYDWQVLNTGGDLSFQYSTDDTASWINSLTIGFNAQLLYEGLLEVTRDTFPVISSIRQETSYVADPTFYFVNSIYTQDTTSAYSENYRGGFALFNTNSAGEKTAAAFFGSALYDNTNGAELGSLKFFPFQAGTTSNGNIGGNLDLRALTSTTGEAVFNSMDVSLAGDNQKLLFGAAQDASIFYDGNDLNINPQEVGTGILNVTKQIRVTNTGTGADLVAVRTDGVAMGLHAGASTGAFGYESGTSFGIAKETRANVLAGTFTGNDFIMLINGLDDITFDSRQVIFKNSGGMVINEDSNDVNVRIEGNTMTNLVKIDGGNDAVGIGNIALPGGAGEVLSVNGTSIFNGDVDVTGQATSYQVDVADALGFIVYGDNGKAGAITVGTLGTSLLYDDSGRFGIQSRPRANVLTGTADANDEVFTILADGKVGIGTIAPGVDLHIKSTTTNVNQWVETTSGRANQFIISSATNKFARFGMVQGAAASPDVRWDVGLSEDSSGNFYIGDDGFANKYFRLENNTGNAFFAGDNVTITNDLTVGGTIFGGSPIHMGDNLNMTEHNLTNLDSLTAQGAISLQMNGGNPMGITSNDVLGANGFEFQTPDATPNLATRMGITGGSSNEVRFYNGNAGSEAAWMEIDNINKRVGIGTISPDSQLHVVSEAADADRGIITAQHLNAVSAAIISFKKSRGTFASQTTVADGDNIGVFWGRPYDGTNYLDNAGFGFLVNGDVSEGTVPVDIIFSTQPTDMVGIEDSIRMRIDSEGNVTISKDLVVNGTIYNKDIFIPQYVFTHTKENITLSGADVWTNVTFGEEVTDIIKGITHTHSDPMNHTFTIASDGVYFIEFDFDIVDTSAGATDIDVAGRAAYVNGDEINGSVFEASLTKQGVEIELSHSFLAELKAGDVVMFEFVADDADVEISTHGTYGDHPESATIIMNKIDN